MVKKVFVGRITLRDVINHVHESIETIEIDMWSIVDDTLKIRAFVGMPLPEDA